MLKTRQMVKLSTLRNAKHNPPNRVLKANIGLLADSMDTLGQLQPITITLDNEIIDGHRRVAAADLIGWKDIEANIVKECDANAVYGSINTTARKLSGSDSLFVWLENNAAVVYSQQKQFKEMEEAIGRPLMKKICKAGGSRRVYLTARRIAHYCEMGLETLPSIVEWLLEFPVSGQIMKAIESGESPQAIAKAIAGGKAVRLKLSVM